jgi:hypothetical protein
VFRGHGVSVVCNVSQDGGRQWGFTKVAPASAVVEGARRVVDACGAYLALNVHGGMDSRELCHAAVAPLCRGTLDVLTERLLPWLEEARRLSGAEIQAVVRNLCGQVGCDECAAGSQPTVRVGVQYLMSALSIGCFAGGEMCDCAVGTCCGVCATFTARGRHFQMCIIQSATKGEWALFEALRVLSLSASSS